MLLIAVSWRLFQKLVSSQRETVLPLGGHPGEILRVFSDHCSGYNNGYCNRASYDTTVLQADGQPESPEHGGPEGGCRYLGTFEGTMSDPTTIVNRWC